MMDWIKVVTLGKRLWGSLTEEQRTLLFNLGYELLKGMVKGGENGEKGNEYPGADFIARRIRREALEAYQRWENAYGSGERTRTKQASGNVQDQSGGEMG